MSHSDPDGWAGADLRAVSQVAVASKGHRLPEKRNFGSDFPFRNFGQLDGVHGEGGVNTHLISGAYGGFSNTWGAGVMVFSEASFNEWPFSRRDLESDYRAILGAIPYAAEDDDLSEYFPLWGPAKPLPPLSENAKRILDAYERHRVEVRRRGVLLGRARLALQSDRCVSCGLCMTGCPYSFVYSASQTFDDLVRDGRIEYTSGHVALRVGEEDGRPFVNARSLESGRVDTFFADKVLLACGALGTTRLVAQSLRLWSTRIHIRESAQFLAPLVSLRGVKRLTQDGTFTLNQFNILLPFDEVGHDLVEIHGYPYNQAIDDALPGVLRRPELRFLRSQILKHLTVGIGYLPSWWSPGFNVIVAPPESDNALAGLTIAPSGSSSLAEAKVREVVRRLARSARYLGWAPVGPQFVLSAPGKSYHFGGSFPHAASPTDLESDVEGRLNAWRHIHLVDASVFPTVPVTTFTLSIMANAHRIARGIAERA